MTRDSIRPLGVEHGLISDTVTSGTFANAHITVCRGELRPEQFEPAYACHGPLQARHPSGTIVVVIAEAGIPIPEGPARQAALRAGEPYAAGIAGNAIVLFGEGFWRSAARSALTAMMLLSRQPYPVKIFADIESAARWAATLDEAGPVDVPGLIGAAEYLRHA